MSPSGSVRRLWKLLVAWRQRSSRGRSDRASTCKTLGWWNSQKEPELAADSQDTLQTLCLELAVSLSELTYNAVSWQLEENGGHFTDFGESNMEYPAGALEGVGVYRRDPASNRYTVEIPPRSSARRPLK